MFHPTLISEVSSDLGKGIFFFFFFKSVHSRSEKTHACFLRRTEEHKGKITKNV